MVGWHHQFNGPESEQTPGYSDSSVPAALGQESQASSCLRKGTPLASRVAQGVSVPSWSSVWKPRVFPDDARECQCPFVLFLHSQGGLRRGVRASGSPQLRTGKSGSFNMGHQPRGLSRISSRGRPHPEGRRAGREPLPASYPDPALALSAWGFRLPRG